MTNKSPRTADFSEEIGLVGAPISDLHAAKISVQDLQRAERIKEALKRGGGRIVVASKIGVHPQSLTRYLAGRDPQSATLAAIADACSVGLAWLATGAGPMNAEVEVLPKSPSEEGSPTYIAIPRYNVLASAGGGTILVEHPQIVEHMAFAEDFLRRHLNRRAEELALIEARGDSMEPTIRDGDILIVDIRRAQPIENGRLYVIRVGEAILVKRVELRITSMVLHSDNPRYSPETLAPADGEQLHIIGQVLRVTAPPR